MKRIFERCNTLWKAFYINRRYVLNESDKYASIVFSIWGFITLVTPTDTMLDCIENRFIRLAVAFLIIVIIYTIIVFSVTVVSKRRRIVKVLDLHSNHHLYVEYGDLFNSGNPGEKKNIAFAGNRCFDVVVNDDLVGSSKVHGIALNRIYAIGDRDPTVVNEEIQRNLAFHEYKKEKLTQKEKRSGNLIRYEVGSVAEIQGIQNERYFILGLTYFDKELRARIDSRLDYIKAMSSLIKFISDRSQGFPTYMPVIGAGGSDVGTVNELAKFMVEIIRMYKDTIDCDIHIVVDENEKEFGLFNLE